MEGIEHEMTDMEYPLFRHPLAQQIVTGGGFGDEQQVGEIWVRGDTVTPGYWNLPAETEQSFTDGWLRTATTIRGLSRPDSGPPPYRDTLPRWSSLMPCCAG